jgi:hypothetical protein
MPDQAQASPAAIGVSAVTLLTWAFTLAGLTSLTGSDPAGNAMTQGFTALGLIVLWILLAVAALIGAKKGAMPRAAGIAALLLRRPGSPR